MIIRYEIRLAGCTSLIKVDAIEQHYFLTTDQVKATGVEAEAKDWNLEAKATASRRPSPLFLTQQHKIYTAKINLLMFETFKQVR